MKLATFTQAGSTRVGKVVGDHILDLSAALDSHPNSLVQLLESQEMLSRAREVDQSQHGALSLADVTLDAPIPAPRKFLAIGMNYRKHVEETSKDKAKLPKYQVWFNKQVTCVNGPYGAIEKPIVSDALDYEAELAFVIGRRCRHVSAEDARDAIAGYMVCNDVTVRDWQRHSWTWTMGKSFDTHGPVGPWLVTADEINDPHDLGIRCYVNGELRQESNTSEMIYNCYDMIEYLSKAFTLEPGDIIATGTPDGIGAAMEPPNFLKAGDVVRCEIDRIGAIENEVVNEAERDG